MQKYIVLLASVLFCSLIFPIPAFASTTYYVSPTGNDNNPGSASQPFASFWQATSVLQPGDELKFYGGTYNQKLFTTKNGTSTQPIKFSAVAGQKPIIDLQNINEPGIYVNSQFVEINDIEVKNIKKNTSGICVYVEADNVKFNNLNIHHCYTHGILMFNKNITLTNSDISYTNLVNQALQPGTQYGSGIKVAIGGENILIEGNTSHHNYGEGIAITRGENVKVVNNISYDNSPTNIYIDNSINITADNNYSYCTGDPGFKKQDGNFPEGFSIGEENYSDTWGSQLSNIIVTNNIVDSCSSGILYWGSDFSNGGLRGGLFAHNTFWNSRFEGIHFNNSPATTNVVIANNISHIATTATRQGVFRNTTGTTVHHNFWVNGYTNNDENAVGVGDLTGDVKFISTPQIGNSNTFILDSTSPAINTGGDLFPYTNLTIDFKKNPRDNKSDIGAYEYAETINSPTPTPIDSCNPADINSDDIVNDTDYSLLITDFFKTSPTNPRSDINTDGIIDTTDYSLLVKNFNLTGICL